MHGIPAFDVQTASTGSDARKLLSAAAEAKSPYEAVVFDLALPRRPYSSEGEDDPNVGIEILANLGD